MSVSAKLAIRGVSEVTIVRCASRQAMRESLLDLMRQCGRLLDGLDAVDLAEAQGLGERRNVLDVEPLKRSLEEGG